MRKLLLGIILASLLLLPSLVAAACNDPDHSSASYMGAQSADVFTRSVTLWTYHSDATDVCYTTNDLREYYCQGDTRASRTITCPNGCSDGACRYMSSACADSDGDTYGTFVGGANLLQCTGSTTEADCNDNNPNIHPEICDGISNDCDSLVDEGLTKPANNVKGACSANTQTCSAGTWSDTASNYVPAAEICGNNIDENCDGADLVCPYCLQSVELYADSTERRDTTTLLHGQSFYVATKVIVETQTKPDGSPIHLYATAAPTITEPGCTWIGSIGPNGVSSGIPENLRVSTETPTHYFSCTAPSAGNVAQLVVTGEQKSILSGGRTYTQTNCNPNQISKSITLTPICTDSDGDGYSPEGGACGVVDCDDDTSDDPDACAEASGDYCGDILVDIPSAIYAQCAKCSNPNPDTPEICGTAIDENCNGQVDEAGCESFQFSTLTVSKIGTGSGTVKIGNTICDFSTNCIVSMVPSASTMSLVATPASGSVFAGWSGDCSGTGSCIWTLTADKAVTAHFEKIYTYPDSLPPGCTDGSCITVLTPTCTDECSTGDTGCSDDSTQSWTCGEANDGDTCKDKVYNSCPSGQTCESGACQTQRQDTAPTCSVSSIIENTNLAYVSGTTIWYNPGSNGAYRVDVTASDDIGVTKVVFPDTTSTAGPDTTSPYFIGYNWQTSSTFSGTATITAYDTVGQTGTCTFEIIPDNVRPTSSNTQPTETVGNLPTISADYSDERSGIKADSILLKLDNSDITSTATKTASSITYIPTTALAEGSHTVSLTIKDNVNNIQTTTWSFTSETPCTDDCTSGAKQCSGAAAYETCGNYDTDSCSEWSSATSCATGQSCSDGSCITPAPTGLTATPTSSSITLDWNIVNEATYKVYRSEIETGIYSLIASPTTNSYQNIDLSTSTTYYYKVSAVIDTIESAQTAVSATTTSSQITAGCTDSDGDGYSLEGGTCGEVDCNDAYASIHPGATEICDGLEDNCNGQIDEDCQAEEIPPAEEYTYPGNLPPGCEEGECITVLCTDSDGDGYTLASTSETPCANPSTLTDCNDGDSNIHPEAPEICNNGKDDDCNSRIDANDWSCEALPISLLGDVDENNDVNLVDKLYVAKILAATSDTTCGKPTQPPCFQKTCDAGYELPLNGVTCIASNKNLGDANGDDNINILDKIYVAKIIAATSTAKGNCGGAAQDPCFQTVCDAGYELSGISCISASD